MRDEEMYAQRFEPDNQQQIYELIAAAKDMLGEYEADYEDPDWYAEPLREETINRYLEDPNKTELQKDFAQWMYEYMPTDEEYSEYHISEMDIMENVITSRHDSESNKYVHPEYVAALLALTKVESYYPNPFVENGELIMPSTIDAMKSYNQCLEICQEPAQHMDELILTMDCGRDNNDHDLVEARSLLGFNAEPITYPAFTGKRVSWREIENYHGFFELCSVKCYDRHYPTFIHGSDGEYKLDVKCEPSHAELLFYSNNTDFVPPINHYGSFQLKSIPTVNQADKIVEFAYEAVKGHECGALKGRYGSFAFSPEAARIAERLGILFDNHDREYSKQYAEERFIETQPETLKKLERITERIKENTELSHEVKEELENYFAAISVAIGDKDVVSKLCDNKREYYKEAAREGIAWEGSMYEARQGEIFNDYRVKVIVQSVQQNTKNIDKYRDELTNAGCNSDVADKLCKNMSAYYTRMTEILNEFTKEAVESKISSANFKDELAKACDEAWEKEGFRDKENELIEELMEPLEQDISREDNEPELGGDDDLER